MSGVSISSLGSYVPTVLRRLRLQAYPDIRQWAHNWIVMFTYLQHSDPTVPYYREVRGASSHVARLAF